MKAVALLIAAMSAAWVLSEATLIVCTSQGCFDRDRNPISCNFGNLSTEVLLIEAEEVFRTAQSQRIFKVEQFIAVAAGVLSVDLPFTRPFGGRGTPGGGGLVPIAGVAASAPGAVRDDMVRTTSRAWHTEGADRSGYVCVDSKPLETRRFRPFGLCCRACI